MKRTVVKKEVKLSKPEMQRLTLHVPPKRDMPSAAKRELLRQQCNSQFNWSDGGNWIGSGPEPSCSNHVSSSGHSKIIYTFPTDAAAFKWNAEWEKAVRQSGHVATAAITVTVTLATGGVAGILVGTLAGISKDEIQGKISYPRVARGWSYVVSLSHTVLWSAHPYGKNAYCQEYFFASYDHQNIQQYSSITKLEFGFDTFPEKIALSLASMPGKVHNVVYQG